MQSPQSRESHLPQSAQKRLISLRLAVDDAEAQRSSLQDRRNRVRPDESIERAALDNRMTENSQALSHARGLLNRVDQWLNAVQAFHHVSPTPLEQADPVKPRQVSVERLAAIRDEIAHLRAQRMSIVSAPVPLDVIERHIREQVASWAKSAEPRIAMQDRPGSPGVRGVVAGQVDFGYAEAPLAPHLYLAWLDGEKFVQRLMDKAKAAYPSKNVNAALTEQDRKIALRDSRLLIFKLELEETALVDELISRGKTDGVAHRLDVSPAALLGVLEPKGVQRTELVA